MRKVFTLFFVVLCSVSMFGNTYKITGGNGNLTGWGTWQDMSVSSDGFYEYFTAAAGNCECKISETGSYDDAMGEYNNRPGYNSTVIGKGTGSTWTDDNHNANYWYDGGEYYILIYYPNTTVNPGTDPIICASTTLPNNPKYYITGNAALVGESVAWNGKAISSSADSYTFTNLAAGEYQLVVLPTGNWSEFDRKYTALTDNTDAGLTGDGDDNICFRLTEPADVTVTYVKTSETSVFTVTTTGKFFSIENGCYLVGTFSGESKWTVTDLTADKKFSERYLGDSKYEYSLVTTVAAGDEIKAAYVNKNAITEIRPTGDNYVIQAEQAGDVTIYFRYDYQESWQGYFYIDATTTALDNTTDSKKAVKRIVDGQLVIIKNGVKYNALGAEVK